MGVERSSGELIFDHVTFKYDVDGTALLSVVKRYGKMDSVEAALSGGLQEPRSKTSTQGDGQSDTEEEEVARNQARLMALDNVTFSAHPGQLVALVQPVGRAKLR